WIEPFEGAQIAEPQILATRCVPRRNEEQSRNAVSTKYRRRDVRVVAKTVVERKHHPEPFVRRAPILDLRGRYELTVLAQERKLLFERATAHGFAFVHRHPVIQQHDR